jgi:hypothetical protein
VKDYKIELARRRRENESNGNSSTEMLNTGIRHLEPPLADHPPQVNDARD